MPEAYRLIGRPLSAPLFYTAGGAVDGAALLRAAARFAESLPGSGPVLNLCTNRLGFTVGILAALLSGRPSVMGPDRSGAGLAGLRAQYPVAAELADADLALTVLPSDRVGPLPANPLIAAGQLAAIVLTSGTTGRPVAHRKLWGALVERSLAAGARFGWHDDRAPWSVLATVPGHHMYGFETSVLLPLHAAVASWSGPTLLPADVRAAMTALPAPTVLVTAPLHLRALVEGGATGPGLRLVISASAPLDPALAAQAEALWGAPVLEIFGATEVGSIASRRTIEGDTWLAYPGVTIEAVTIEAVTIEAGTTTVVTAPHAPATALADVIEPAGTGQFRLLGRQADLVKVAGKRASLAALTRMLAALPGVEDAAFLVPDELERGGRLIAFAVAPSRCADELLTELRHQIDPAFLPRRVLQVERLPRNEVGKVQRQALLALLAAMSAGPA